MQNIELFEKELHISELKNIDENMNATSENDFEGCIWPWPRNDVSQPFPGWPR